MVGMVGMLGMISRAWIRACCLYCALMAGGEQERIYSRLKIVELNGQTLFSRVAFALSLRIWGRLTASGVTPLLGYSVCRSEIRVL